MPTKWMGCALLALWVCAGAAQAMDKDKLRAATWFPSVRAEYGIGVKYGHYYTKDASPEVGAEIQAVQKQLQGNAQDAALYLKMGDLYDDADKDSESRHCFEKARDLFKQQLASEPNQARLLVGYASALGALGQHPEDETLLRRAVTLASQDGRCFLELAGCLVDKAARLLFHHDGPRPKARSYPVVPQPPLSLAEAAMQAEKGLQEARACLDQAATLAPNDPEVFRRRAALRLSMALPEQGLALARRQPPVYQNVALAMLLPESRADLYRLAQLEPDNYLAWGMVAQLEIQALSYEKGAGLKGKPALAQLSAEAQQRTKDAWAALARLSQSSNRPMAARSALVLGWLQTMTDTDPALAKATLKRALALDPSLTVAWELLIATVMLADQNAEGLALCTERLKHSDTAQARFFLARAYYRNKEEAKGAEQLRLALQRDPKDFHALVGNAVLLLRDGKDNTTLAAAGQLLARAQPLVGQDPGRRCDWNLNQGVYLALTGDINAARCCLLDVIVINPQHKEANAALKALAD